MDSELIIFLWATGCGAAGGFGRFCRNYELYKKWKMSSIVAMLFCSVVVGAICAMIAVGWVFENKLVENRLKAFSLATAAGYLPIQIPIIIQMLANAFNAKTKSVDQRTIEP